MRTALSLLAFISFGCLTAMAVPETIQLEDGRVLEKVTAATVEDGKVKVSHSGGVSRHEVATLKADSRKALGLDAGDSSERPQPELTRIETTDGKVYEDVRSVKATPSFLSFVHREGASSVRFEQLPISIQTAFGYDEAAAKAFDEDRAAAEDAMVKAEVAAAATEQQIAQRKAARSEARERVYFQSMMQEIEWSAGPNTRWGGGGNWCRDARGRFLNRAADARYYKHGR